MGYLKYVREAWKNQDETMRALWHERLISWRKENATVRVEHPTRPDRAHSLGYKAKQGVFVVRQRVQRGGRKREVMDGGRRSKRSSLRLNLNKNYQQVAEERAQKSYINCVVLNSYWVGQDGKNIWYEIVMVDPGCPVVQSDKQLSWTMDKAHQGRAHRGLTSAGRKARGLRNKGKGAEKLRPSKGASWRRKANSWGKFF